MIYFLVNLWNYYYYISFILLMKARKYAFVLPVLV